VHINQWVAAQTRERIQDLLPSPSIDADTRLVLTNALYLKAKWLDPFEPRLTRDAWFWVDGRTRREVPTMVHTASFRFAELPAATVIELPYAYERFTFVVVLPRTRDGLAALEKRLTVDTWEGWLSALSYERVQLSLPKLWVEPAASMALKPALVAMGMKLAFDREQADFTLIAQHRRAEDRLSISKVFHKTVVEVNEAGTEAAAATAVVMARAGGVPMKPKEVAIDHPFLFAIRDSENGALLFFGRVTEPKAR
jgi:serpin B